ncbi:MAG: NAD(P)/FAD-dependent oxidoreductase [Candidatus Saganbacteria bacterium]|nr:NAD(P)/FAD-dependent oxidoreductase [Candidatus Saganbacteria bacterium]
MHCKYTIIGAGVIGLAIARELSSHIQDDMGVVVVEKERTSGTGISSRNSEVIHAGIYYPFGSLKHLLCIEGRRALYEYCAQKNLPYKKCGKLIVATHPDESEALAGVYAQAQKNGVENVVKLTKAEALALEPDLNVHEALLSKETGILNAHSLMAAIEKDVTANNGTIVHDAEVIRIEHSGKDFSVALKDGTVFTTSFVINCAGLDAVKISKMLGQEPVTMYPCKGSYFSYSGRHNCQHLIYPIPETKLTGLGVHATVDINGSLKFGPDTEYVDSTDDYSVDEKKRMEFYLSAKKLLKNIEEDKVAPDMSGIRPKIQGPDDKEVKDFHIKEDGYPGFINLLGIESPGLTSALAIAKYVWENFLA